MGKLTKNDKSKIMQMHKDGLSSEKIAKELAADTLNPVNVSHVAVWKYIDKTLKVNLGGVITTADTKRMMLKIDNENELQEQINKIIKTFGSTINETYRKIEQGENVTAAEMKVLLEILKIYSNLTHVVPNTKISVTQDEVYQSYQDKYMTKTTKKVESNI